MTFALTRSPLQRARSAWLHRTGILIACSLLVISRATPQQTPDPQPPPIPPVKTSITVTDRVGAEAPAAITVLDRTAVQQQPGLNVDDRLRVVPGFSLFRRSSSVVANPATQGVSLRGLGSSGAGRTLVLW